MDHGFKLDGGRIGEERRPLAMKPNVDVPSIGQGLVLEKSQAGSRGDAALRRFEALSRRSFIAIERSRRLRSHSDALIRKSKTIVAQLQRPRAG